MGNNDPILRLVPLIGGDCFSHLEKEACAQGLAVGDVLREAVLFYFGQLSPCRLNKLVERAEAECLRLELLGDIAQADKETLATLRAIRAVQQNPKEKKGD